MKRKDFIRKGIITGFSFGFLGKVLATDTGCNATPDETEGPFPTHHPSTLLTQNITSDRKGIPLIIHIAILNTSKKCEGLQNAIVDIWHCDSKGEYSEYGGKDEHGNGMPDTMRMPPPGAPAHDSLGIPPMPMFGGSMQAADHQKEHFLRGRQITNKSGVVSFHSIYPGWYSGRAPHIHVHIYSSAGKSLLITQVAFPEEISKDVYTRNVYAAHGQPDTTNATDMVFNDSIANELATVTGNSKDGYVLKHSIYVKA